MAAAASRPNLTFVPRLRITGLEPIRPSRVRLGEFEFDCKAGELCSREGNTVLQSQPHKILLMLVEHPGEVVTRQEIEERLWPDGVIVNFDVSINQAMSKLRHDLNDSASDPRYIETVGRRGYRLLVPVEPVEEARQTANAAADPLLQLVAGAMGYGADEMKAIAEGLIKLLPLLVCLNRTSAVETESRTTLVRRIPQAM